MDVEAVIVIMQGLRDAPNAPMTDTAERAEPQSTGEDAVPPNSGRTLLFRINNKFEADNIIGPIWTHDEYRIGKQRFAADDVIVDIGAHIGVFSCLCYTRGCRALYCYEPAEQNFQLLKRNLGSHPGVHLSRTAVWRSDDRRPAELLLSASVGENTGSNSVLAAGRAFDYPNQELVSCESPGSSVPVVPLDQILERFDRVKLLKLDCEGSEFPILLTSRQLRRVERIVGEVHEIGAKCMELVDAETRISGYPEFRVEDLAAHLKSIGFHVTTRRVHPHMHLIDARRRAPKPSVV